MIFLPLSDAEREPAASSRSTLDPATSRDVMLLRRSLPRALESRSTVSLQQSFSSRTSRRPLLHPAYDTLSLDVAHLPHFRTRAENVQVLNQPCEFYSTLIVSLLSSEQRGRPF